MPPLAVLPALIAAGSGIAGVVEGAQAGNRQQKALTQQEQIASQEMGDKQQAFKQLTDFFTPYLQEGSPFLKLIQQAAGATTATGANNAAGQIRNTVGASGLGFGPSGTTGAAIANEGAQTNAQSSSNYLQNLLNNEAVKFQAAQGINAAGSMAGSSQNQPNVGVNLPFQSTGTGLTGLGQILQGLLKPPGTPTSPGGGTPVAPGQPPLPSLPSNPPGWGIGLPSTSGTPTTQGWEL